MVKPVRLLNDPILRKRADEVQHLEFLEIELLLKEMFETMKAEGGIGLAANQIGVSSRVFILGVDNVEEAFINPEIISQSEPVEHSESCLSIPGAAAPVVRNYKCRLRFIKRDAVGLSEFCEEDFEGTKAVAIQHEMDHLDGKLYIDYLGPIRKSMTVAKHNKYMKFRR